LIRNALYELEQWLTQKNRKPLVLRGVRQSGKTWLVRELAKSKNLQLIEINFENRPELRSLFVSNDPKSVWSSLETLLPSAAERTNCLLFLDEVQTVPEMLAKLRWFYEILPDLAVIAAGSLLDFVLHDHTFSMPVGRVQFFYLEPLSFCEFLQADQQHMLVEYLKKIALHDQIPEAIHQSLMQAIDNYALVGGMPEAVQSWVDEHSFLRVNQIHRDLLTAYQNDFAKYPTRIAPERLHEVMLGVSRMLGKKFTYAHVNPDVKSQTIGNAVSLLMLARVVHKVQAVAADGVPLGAKPKQKYFKIILCDVGLVNVNIGISLSQLKPLSLTNNGEIAEQLAGQMLRKNFLYFQDPALYYWQREGQSNAEIDYVIQFHDKIIPVEVKAVSGNTLRSLHYFMHVRQLKFAVRIYGDTLSITPIETKLSTGEVVSYSLLSIPFYLIEELPRLLEDFVK
jgi:predicted AAA+ superfamily ATPase